MMKPNLLLLHGALGTKTQFSNLTKELSNHFTIHSFDFEGHGENASSNDFSMNLFAENVIQYLKEKEIEQINIFGYSMGGYVALNLAYNYPNFVHKITTLGTKFNWSEEAANKEVKMLNPDKIEAKVPKFAQHLASLHSSNNWKEVVQKTAQMMLDLGAGKRFTENEFKAIQHQILINIGDMDKMVSIEESKEVTQFLPKGKLNIIEGFPHPIEKVDLNQLATIIFDFFKL